MFHMINDGAGLFVVTQCLQKTGRKFTMWSEIYDYEMNWKPVIYLMDFIGMSVGKDEIWGALKIHCLQKLARLKADFCRIMADFWKFLQRRGRL